MGTEELAKAFPISICRKATFPEWGEKTLKFSSKGVAFKFTKYKIKAVIKPESLFL